MASGGKKKTTMAKLMRERKVLERRLDKQAKKDARKRAAAEGLSPHGEMPLDGEGDDETGADAEETALEPVAQTLDA